MKSVKFVNLTPNLVPSCLELSLASLLLFPDRRRRRKCQIHSRGRRRSKYSEAEEKNARRRRRNCQLYANDLSRTVFTLFLTYLTTNIRTKSHKNEYPPIFLENQMPFYLFFSFLNTLKFHGILVTLYKEKKYV